MLFRVCTALLSIYLNTYSPDTGWWIHLTAYKIFNFTYLDQWLSSELMEKLTHRILKTHRKQISALAATLTHSVVTPQLWQSPDCCLELHLIRNNVIVVSVCLTSDSLSQRLPSYWVFSRLGRGLSTHGPIPDLGHRVSPHGPTPDLAHGVSPHGPSPDLGRGVSPHGPTPELGHGVSPHSPSSWPWTWGMPSLPSHLPLQHHTIAAHHCMAHLKKIMMIPFMLCAFYHNENKSIIWSLLYISYFPHHTAIFLIIKRDLKTPLALPTRLALMVRQREIERKQW